MAAEIHIHNLTIEPAPDGQSVSLSQDLGGDRHFVSLHASQVRALADLMSLGAGEVERLHRALLWCWEMAAGLQRNLQVTADLGHEDLDVEVARVDELVDFLAFVCADFEDRYGPLPIAPEPAPSIAPDPARAAPLSRSATSGQLRAAFDQGRASAGDLFTSEARR